MPRAITHDLRLRRARLPVEEFLNQTAGLQQKRGPLLVQLPPSLAFDARVSARFFALVRGRYDGLLVCEPRHPTWFSAEADRLFVRFRIGRVAADPAPVAGADCPGGWDGIVYVRLHGAPRKYWSRYDGGRIAAVAELLSQLPRSVAAWCVFDNTASGAAIENAWDLQSLLQR